jgi:hypothetical protein
MLPAGGEDARDRGRRGGPGSCSARRPRAAPGTASPLRAGRDLVRPGRGRLNTLPPHMVGFVLSLGERAAAGGSTRCVPIWDVSSRASARARWLPEISSRLNTLVAQRATNVLTFRRVAQRLPRSGRSAPASRERLRAVAFRPSSVRPRMPAARSRPAHASAHPRSGPAAEDGGAAFGFAEEAASGGSPARECDEAGGDSDPSGGALIGRGAPCGAGAESRARPGAGSWRGAPCGAGARRGVGPRVGAALGAQRGAGAALGARAGAGAGLGAGRDTPPGAGTGRRARPGTGAARGAGATRGAGAARGAGAGLGASGAGAGTGAGWGACDGGGVVAGGSNESGSTYAYRLPASRTPKWRCGAAAERSPLVPTEPRRSPPDTRAPARTAIADRCR